MLCTSGGLYGALVMESLLQHAALDVVGLVRSTRVLDPRYGLWRGAVAQLSRSGPAYTAYLAVATTLADLARQASGAGSVEGLARRHGIARHATRDLNDAAGRAFVAATQADLLVSAFFNQRIGERVCEIPRAGAVNIHPSLLPDFRGVDPVFQAMRQRAGQQGVSVHRLTPRFDEGPLICQHAVAVPPDDSLLHTTARLFVRGASAVAETLPALLAGDPGRPQPSGGRYDSWPTPEQVAGFRRAGGRLVAADDRRLFGRSAMRHCLGDA